MATVLLVTHSGDHFTIDRVAEAVARRGGHPFRLDTDLYPSEIRLSFDGHRHWLVHGERQLDAADVRAVWMRKLWLPRLPDDLDPRFRDGVVRQAAAALHEFLDGCAPARWIDPRLAQLAGESKLRQLTIARRVGLQVPATLCSNDAAEARAFFAAQGGEVVAKLLAPLSFSMGRAPVFMYTSQVKADDIAALDGLDLSPMLFQRRIEKRRELRAIHVAGRFFTGAIDASDSALGQDDWRRVEADEAAWQPAELPEQVAGPARALMSELGLCYGAFDFIETPGGEHVFLEVNPAGEWGMLERDLGLPIGDALAEALLA